MLINYQLIADAQKHYESCGFLNIESPWTVTKEISDITRPPDKKDFQLAHENGKVLVASGEQSFLYLYAKGFLPKGQFQTTTPCFRFENFGPLHSKYFIKTELIKTDEVSEKSLEALICCAMDFFSKYFPKNHKLNVLNCADGSYDIRYDDVELGSYGIRSCDYLTWIYGTGVAEPRMSLTRKKYGLSS